jgi:hypothetical protein
LLDVLDAGGGLVPDLERVARGTKHVVHGRKAHLVDAFEHGDQTRQRRFQDLHATLGAPVHRDAPAAPGRAIAIFDT